MVRYRTTNLQTFTFHIRKLSSPTTARICDILLSVLAVRVRCGQLAGTGEKSRFGNQVFCADTQTTFNWKLGGFNRT